MGAAGGYADRRALVQSGGPAGTILRGLEGTGFLWEPISEAFTRSSYARRASMG